MASRRPPSPFPIWALWAIGAVTILAAGILILSVVLGLQDGRNQLDRQNRQQVVIALQQAMDRRAEGNLQAALAEYQRVLLLDPGNEEAMAGISGLLQLASAGVEPGSATTALDPNTVAPTAMPGAVAAPTTAAPAEAATVAPAAPPTNTPAPTATIVAGPDNDLWVQARGIYETGDWQQTILLLNELQSNNPAFNADQVKELLFNSYVNLAAEKDRSGNLEETLQLVDKALELRPESMELRRARTLAAKYVDVLTYFGADWSRAIELLKELYDRDPTYRDVEARLEEALVEFGDQLVGEEEYCEAVVRYNEALAFDQAPGLVTKRDRNETLCQGGGLAVAEATSGAAGVNTTAASQSAAPAAVAVPAADPTADPAAEEPAEVEPAPVPTIAPTSEPVAAAPVGSPSGGRLLYSAQNPVDSRTHIFVQNVGDGNPPGILVEDGQQPALRADGGRLLYRNLRDDSLGVTAFDPGTGLTLRFTKFSEDTLPSWSQDASRFVFASNRDGDRRWRIYVNWADVDNEAVNLGFGESPKWHPTADRIAFRGCDESGNGCGLWTMNGGGGDRLSLTSTPVDYRPSWSPSGQYVVFMSDGRHGNPEIYRVTVATGEVLRLTDHPATDAVPVVSPDGAWVAFFSNRDGVWRIWAVPIDGGAPQILADVAGSVANWFEQDIQWVN